MVSAGGLSPERARERLAGILQKKGITDERVLEAVKRVERHKFTTSDFGLQAYDDNALPIGNGQTISQPFVVALMTQLLSLGIDDKILEIGTGSGYQAAILSYFSKRIFTIERHRELSKRAQKVLRELGYENIVFKVGDGTTGWPACAPFDRIIVTAAAPSPPQELLQQLAVGGLMVIPAGSRKSQNLYVYKRVSETRFEKEEKGGVVFVPLVGNQGWQE